MRQHSSSSLKAGKPQIPKLTKPCVAKQEYPFEKYQHFVVCPPRPPVDQKILTTPSAREAKIQQLKSDRDASSTEIFIDEDLESAKFTQYPYEVSMTSEELDQLILDASNTAVHIAAEKFLEEKFHAQTVIFWENIPELQILYSQTYKISAARTESIASSSFFTRTIIRTTTPTLHPAFSPKIDRKFCPGDVPTMVFPLWDYQNSLCAIVQIIRPFCSQEFTGMDENYALRFASKFKTFSRFLLSKPISESFLLDVLTLKQKDDLLLESIRRIANFFGCKNSEVWRLDNESQTLLRFNDGKEFPMENAGIVGVAIENQGVTNLISNKLHPSYNPEIDGEQNMPVLIAPVKEQRERYVIAAVLRGSSNRSVFLSSDEDSLMKIVSFFALSLSNSSLYTSLDSEMKTLRERSDSLAALLEIAETLSKQLDIDKLTAAIMEKGRSLTQSDRCSLFLLNKEKDRLVTSFQHGLANAIDIPLNKGIAGKTFNERRTIMLKDAYDDPDFDRSIDSETGYKTTTILSVPILNHHNEVIGVTEMVNKAGGAEFNEWDQQMIQIFNVFCGISLENSKLYSESTNMSQQLRSFFDVSFSLSQKESIHGILTDIIKNARVVIGATFASLFLVDTTASLLTSYLYDGGRLPPTLPLNTGVAGACAKSKEVIIVNNAYEDKRFNKSVDEENGFKTDSLMVAPVISSAGEVLGVVEMVNKNNGEFNEKDIDLLKSFATFAAVSLENERLKSIAELGTAEVELPKFISETERKQTTIPAKLILSEESQKKASSLNFLCIEWKGASQIKLLFYLFNKFEILEQFNITNDMFFHFLLEMRSQYHDVPYHNWTHACDVSQYVAYELTTSGMYKRMTPLERFAIMVAAVCHDAGHDGFNNVYNVKAETPLGILYKEQSVMETHHCTVAIRIMSKDEFNLMHSLSPEDVKKMWTMIIQLILATDMAHHFKLVKEAASLLDEDRFDMEDPACRMLAFKLLLKTADISNVSRPFKIADKWCDVLNEEFFRQGDNEKSQGIELTSPLNDREHPNKPKSQIGFYNFVCLPLYQVVARLFPELIVNQRSVESNLEVWKKIVEEEENAS